MSGPNPESLQEEVEAVIRSELERQAEGGLWYEHLVNLRVDRIDGDLDVTALAARLIEWFSRN